LEEPNLDASLIKELIKNSYRQVAFNLSRMKQKGLELYKADQIICLLKNYLLSPILLLFFIFLILFKFINELIILIR